MPTLTPRQQKIADRKASAARIAAAKAEAAQVVTTGRCPTCGGKLRANLSITGWWQCEQYGSGSFRARPNEAACSFQCFV